MNKLVLMAMLALPVLVQAQASGSTPPLTRTDPSAWSKDGYQQLRFGMGPGDVAEALKKPGFTLTTKEALVLHLEEPNSETLTEAVISGHMVRLMDAPVSITVRFHKGRLYNVSLWPVNADGSRLARSYGHTFELSVLLEEKYGKPASVEEGGWSWKRDDFMIDLLKIGTLTYRSNQLEKEAGEDKGKAWKEARQREKDSL